MENLRPSNRRGVRLEQNPETPVNTVTTQAESNTPLQPQKRAPYQNYLHSYHYLRTNLNLGPPDLMKLRNRNKQIFQFQIHNTQILHPQNLYTTNLTKKM